MWWRSWRLAIACGALLVAVAAVPARGEEEPGDGGTWWGIPGLPEQWSRDIPPSPAVGVPRPITQDDQIEEVSLKQTIAIALDNNPGIAARRLEPGLQEEGILQAQSKFDPLLSSDISSNQSTTPNANSLNTNAETNVDDRRANLRLLKTTRLGTQLSLDFLNQRLDSSASFFALRPQYTPELGFSIVQPLLRDFGWDFSYLVVRVAQQAADAAVYRYEAQLADFVLVVIQSYWAVVGARENLEAQRESKALADRTVEENEARVRVGLLAPVAVLEAQADAASREEDVLIAENALQIARQRLAQIAYHRPDRTFVPRTLEPLPTQELVKTILADEIRVDIDEALGTALATRPEILASEHDVRGRQLDERIAANSLLPRIDLVGGYAVNGLSGQAIPVSIFSQTDLGGGRCVGTAATGFRCTVLTPFGGPRGDAYDRLVSDDFHTYSFGVQVQVPLSNALARSQQAQSRIARDQAELVHRQLLSDVTLEVRQAAADLLAARKRIETSRVARELAAENLRNQEKRHEVGMATTKDLLDFQTRLTNARAAQIQANIDYVNSVAAWRRAQGRLLPEYQVVIEQPGHRSAPWFAQF